MEKAINIQNRKARFEYHFIKTEVAGIVLQGTEVKGIREGLVSFVDSFCYFKDGELFLKGINIGNPKYAVGYQHDPLRERKLLMSKKELKKWLGELDNSITIIPTNIFTNERGFIKIGIALAKGKKLYDKKKTIKERDIQKEIKRDLSR